VRGVVTDSPAEKAGVERGDLLVSVNGHPLSSVDELFDALDAGGPLKVTVVRGTDEREVEISLQ
jgi:S1-C subfamily serine protease